MAAPPRKDLSEDSQSQTLGCLFCVVKATAAPSSHDRHLPDGVFRSVLTPKFFLF